VVYFQSAAAAPGLAEAAQAATWPQIVFLRGREMEKSQGYRTAAVLQTRHQGAAAAKDDIRRPDLALDHHVSPLNSSGDGCDAGAILVAKWQVEQQVIHTVNAVIREFACQFRADTAQFLYRGPGDISHLGISLAGRWPGCRWPGVVDS
jgi:hypothetical protein